MVALHVSRIGGAHVNDSPNPARDWKLILVRWTQPKSVPHPPSPPKTASKLPGGWTSLVPGCCFSVLGPRTLLRS